MRTAAACILTLLLIAPAGAQDLRESSEGFELTRTRSFTQSVDHIRIGGLSGSLRIVGGASSVELEERLVFRVRERSEARRLLEVTPDDARIVGTTFEVDTQPVREVSRQLRLRVPERVSILADLAGGAIEVTGTRGDARLRTSGGAVSVENLVGRLEISSAGGALSVRSVEGPVRATTSGGSVSLRGVAGRVEVVTAGGGVLVRETGSDVQVSTAGGEVIVEGAAGRVEVSTAGGDINVTSVGGAAELSTAGGNLAVRAIAGHVEGTTSGGDVSAQELLAGADLETFAGDIVLLDVAGPLRVMTQVGDVILRLSATEDAPDVTATTQSGDVEIWLSQAVSARLEATLGMAGGLSGHDISSDFPVTRESLGSARIRSVGVLGAGAGRVRLDARNGSIRIRTLR
ncbi:MAG: DUF4097 family beta strand repeat protein [Rhodothermales bacterium]|nr:DUF4097 family beta strand repeat protein [Rhodothermales bacterium]MBO6780110.1 DUF4097 family beta strand repeat protein [Rhodothermales bacterium]